MTMFIHFFCLCPLNLTIKMNFNISKVVYCFCIRCLFFVAVALRGKVFNLIMVVCVIIFFLVIMSSFVSRSLFRFHLCGPKTFSLSPRCFVLFKGLIFAATDSFLCFIILTFVVSLRSREFVFT